MLTSTSFRSGQATAELGLAELETKTKSHERERERERGRAIYRQLQTG